MQGLDEEESENLAALGMHITGKNGDDDDEDEKKKDEEDEIGVEKALSNTEPVEAAEEEEKKDEPEELDELKELDRLAKVLKEDDEPTMVDEEE